MDFIRSLSHQLVQFLYDQNLKAIRESKRLPWYLRLLRRYFNRVSRNVQTIVIADIYNIRLALPITHELPLILIGYPNYAKNLARLANTTIAKYPSLSCLDIGANIGDTVALLRSEHLKFPILCVEGDLHFLTVLRHNLSQFRNLQLASVYLGETDAVIDVQHHRSRGTARLVTQGAAQSKTEIKTLPSLLVEFPDFRTAKLLKIDTDGFDNKILRGAETFLKQVQPVIFFEYDPTYLEGLQGYGADIFDFLASCGYHDLLFYDNFGRFILSTNTKEQTLLSDLSHYCLGRDSKFYWDIAAFAMVDGDLCQTVKACEIEYWQSQR